MVTTDLDTILALERAVWEALVAGDAAADAALLHPGFLGVYETGFGDHAEHVGQLSRGPTVARFQIRDARLLALAEDLVLLAYRADYLRAGPGAEPETMWVSSIWKHGSGGWRNIFSQDTAAGRLRPV